MPAATTREDLLAIAEKEHGKLIAVIDGLSDTLAAAPLGEDGISIKDTLAHRAHWLDLFVGWYEDGRAGKTVETPAPGYKWNQLKAYNAMVRQASRDTAWAMVRADFDRAHDGFMALVTSLDQSTLYTPKLYPWMNDWTVGRWAEAAGPSNYRSAVKFIRKILRDAKATGLS